MKNPAESTLLSSFKESVTHFPQQLTVVFNGLNITYKELDKKNINGCQLSAGCWNRKSSIGTYPAQAVDRPDYCNYWRIKEPVFTKKVLDAYLNYLGVECGNS